MRVVIFTGTSGIAKIFVPLKLYIKLLSVDIKLKAEAIFHRKAYPKLHGVLRGGVQIFILHQKALIVLQIESHNMV